MRRTLGTLVVTALVAAAAFSYEIRFSRLDTWELDFESNPPRVYEIKEGDALGQYTYIIYRVTNNTDEEIDFFPTFEIETEAGVLHRSGLYPKAYERIVKGETEKILSFPKIARTLKPGQTRRGVAVFKGVDPAADELTVYVTGLSGDMKLRRDKEGRIKAEYKTYKLIYSRPGDAYAAALDPVKLESSEWIWR